MDRNHASSIALSNFWSGLIENGQCLEWSGTRSPCGYGLIGRGVNFPRLAHRCAWWLTFGQIPEGMQVCHRCDNPQCVNPDHLFLGTQADNVADMISKGRHVGHPRAYRPRLKNEGKGIPRGAERFRAKLTDALVIEMRRRRLNGETVRSLASHFGVATSGVIRVCRGDLWSHVPMQNEPELPA